MSTFNKAKYLSPSFGALIGPSMVSPVLKENLLFIVKRHVLQSVMNYQQLSFPIYFEGIPGSGKTHAAQGIAKITGVPIASVVLDGASIEGGSYLTASQYSAVNYKQTFRIGYNKHKK